MKEISLSGSFYEMGRQYGAAMKKETRNFVTMTRMMAAIAEGEGRDFFRPQWYHVPGAILQMRKYRRTFRKVAGEFEKNIAAYYPELLEMIHGMADSTKIDYRDLIFMNCMTEYSLKCSTMAAAGSSTAGGSPLLAMNADESKHVQKYEVMIDVNPTNGYRYKAVFMAGTVLQNFGMNEHGLSIVSELLFVKNPGVTDFRFPLLLKNSVYHRCANVDEARDLLNGIPASGIGGAFYVADAEKVFVIEDNAMEKYTHEFSNGYYFNCNLPKSDLIKKYDDRDSKNGIVLFYAVDRERRLGNLFSKFDGRIDEDHLYDFISDHGSDEDGTKNKSICVHPENTKGIKTCASFIASPERRTFRAYEGNPCRKAVQTYSFD